jgi:hypothetical protein
MSIIDIIQTIGLVITLALAIIQLRIYSKTARASTYPVVMRRLDEINHVIIEHPEIMVKLSEPYPGRDNIFPDDRRPGFLYIVFSFYEELYFHNKYGYIEKEIWDGWVRSMKRILKQPYAAGFWKEVRYEHYGTNFATFIDSLIAQLN